MRILILNQYCAPEPNFKSVPFAAELMRRGHEVRILTGFPNYPGGRLYPGYRLRLWQRESIQDVPILRVPLYPSHDRSSLRRLLNYVSFAACALPPLLFGWKPDLIYAYGLVTKGMVASLAGRVRRGPFVFDIQDLWPDALINSGMSKPWMLAPVERALRHVYRRAAGIVVLSPGFKKRLAARGVPEEKIEVIYNWCDEDALRAARSSTLSRGTLGFEGRFNILFAGTMSRAQGLDAVVDAAAIVARTHPQIQFIFMGSGRLEEHLRERAASVAPAATRFLPRCSPAEAAAIQEQAEVALVHLRQNPLYEITIPSKTQAYLAKGRPILIGVKGDAADLVRRAGAGVACEPEDPDSIATAAIRMAQLPENELQAMGTRGRAFYEQELCLRVGAARFERCFEGILTGRTAEPNAARAEGKSRRIRPDQA